MNRIPMRQSRNFRAGKTLARLKCGVLIGNVILVAAGFTFQALCRIHSGDLEGFPPNEAPIDVPLV